MVSRVQQKIQKARERDVFVFRLPRDLWQSNRLSWGLYAEGEFSFRGPMSHRAAKNLAYAISVSKKQVIRVVL